MSDTVKIHRGLLGVEIGTTAICFIDGENGRLAYRGYPIEELVETAFEDVAFLLLKGRLPKAAESRELRVEMTRHRTLPEPVLDALSACENVLPDAALRVGLSMLRSDQPDEACVFQTIVAIASIIVTHHALRRGAPSLPPDPELDHATDFLRRLTGHIPSPMARQAMNLDLVLHAEHGANASTFAARVAAEAGCDLNAALTTALSCLAGPKHGGAVTAVAEILAELASPEAAKAFARDQSNAKAAIPGFGHRVYKVEDPRARNYRSMIDKLVDEAGGVCPPIVDVAAGLAEGMAPFARFGIAPNDDLACCVLYNCLDLPRDLYTSLFAAGRVAGWAAHFFEAKSDLDGIGVPQLYYVGEPERELSNLPRANTDN